MYILTILIFAILASTVTSRPTRVNTAKRSYTSSNGEVCYFSCPTGFVVHSGTGPGAYTCQYITTNGPPTGGACSYSCGTGDADGEAECNYDSTTGHLKTGQDPRCPTANLVADCISVPQRAFKRSRGLTNAEKIIKARQFKYKLKK